MITADQTAALPDTARKTVQEAIGQVRQADARNLWDEAVTAYQWWINVWLDDPANLVTTLV